MQLTDTHIRMINITSYNVLCSHLADPKQFSGCKPEFLDAQYRLNELFKKLDEEVSNRAIICLQEISIPWSGKLHKYFVDHNYYLVTAQYGNKYNGYMGVGIAIPLDAYSIQEINIQKIGDTKSIPKRAVPPWSFIRACFHVVKSFVAFLISSFWKLLIFLKLYVPPPMKYELWDSVTYRANQMICVRLKQRGSGIIFAVGNYHMPCMFDLPPFMMAHCALSAQYLHKFAAGDPYIYAGDFNIKPDSTMYRLLTEGRVEKSVSMLKSSHFL